MGRFALLVFAVIVAAVIAFVSHGDKRPPATQPAAPPQTQAAPSSTPGDKNVYIVETTVGGSHYSVSSDCPQPTEWTYEQVERWEKRCIVKTG